MALEMAGKYKGRYQSAPSGLRTDIKLWPSKLVRTQTDIKLRPIGLVRSYKD